MDPGHLHAGSCHRHTLTSFPILYPYLLWERDNMGVEGWREIDLNRAIKIGSLSMTSHLGIEG